MSAFIVSHKHINSLLTFASRRQARGYLRMTFNGVDINLSDPDGIQKAAEILLAENYRSIYARYPDCADNPQNAPGNISEAGKRITYKIEPRPLTAVEVMKACDCYDYQACETGDYEQSTAHALIDGIRRSAVYMLPGYDDAAWEIR